MQANVYNNLKSMTPIKKALTSQTNCKASPPPQT